MAVFIHRDTCPGCGSTDFRIVYSAPLLDYPVRSFFERKFSDLSMLPLFEGVPYELLKCLGCGLIFQGHILTDEYLSKLYGDWLENYVGEAEMAERDSRRVGFSLDQRKVINYANELLMLARYLRRPPREITVLDYGAGNGSWCLMASALEFDVAGADLSETRVNALRERGIKTEDIHSLPKGAYDFINTEQVFEHLPRPLELIQSLSASLKPGGILKISVPEGRGVEGRLKHMDWNAPRGTRKFVWPATPLIHINTFTNQAIASMGQRVGLCPIHIPLSFNYSVIDGQNLKGLSKSFLRPIFRRIFKPTYVLLRSPLERADGYSNTNSTPIVC